MNRLKPFAVALAGISLLATGMVPVASHAESLQDVFTQQELDILFGEGAQIPKYIGPHRVVMSLEEAQQVEGELAPLIVIGLGAIGGAGNAAIQGNNVFAGALTGAAVGGGAVVTGGMAGAIFGPGAINAGQAAGGVLFGWQMTALTNLPSGDGDNCMNCHQVK